MNKIITAILLLVLVSGCANGGQKDSGLIFNYDSNFFLQQTPIEKMTVEGMCELVDLYAGTQVKRMFLNVNAQTTTYKSNVWDSVWDDDDIEVLKKEEHWEYKAKLLHERGIDPYEVWIKGFRKKGVSPWVSMRMNDVHYNNDISHWIHSKFWREHPEYWRVEGEPQKNNFDRAFDYEHKEVRDYHMALIKELLERYDVDGVELDWLREPFCFRQGREAIGLRLLTEFMSEVRQLANQWAVKRGHPIQIAARVPVHPDTAKGFGLFLFNGSHRINHINRSV